MKRLGTILLAMIPVFLMASQPSPYAGEEQQSVKSLSTDEIDALRSGHGMGFAKLAELNHFPGPAHVLDLAGELELTPTQLAATEALYREMQRNAIALGEELIQAETALDRAFADGSVESRMLESALLKIGKIQARLRYVHLEAHLRQKELLTRNQVLRYDEIRGYRKSSDDHGQHAFAR